MTPLARQLRQIASGSRPLGRSRGASRPLWTWVHSGLESHAGKTRKKTAKVDRLARVEAVLLLAREALSTRRLAQLANLADGAEARVLVGQLVRRYNDQGRAFQLETVAGGYQLLTRPQFAPWIAKLGPTADLNGDFKLSPPALDTLAVVAYRQPVLRAEIEAIRGVGCGELLRQLIERDLLRIVGRSQELGRPLLYGTTKKFLETFGLRNLNDLPQVGGLVPTAADASISLKAA